MCAASPCWFDEDKPCQGHATNIAGRPNERPWRGRFSIARAEGLGMILIAQAEGLGMCAASPCWFDEGKPCQDTQRTSRDAPTNGPEGPILIARPKAWEWKRQMKHLTPVMATKIELI
ncbi:MAG: hypothetical protein KatS3mg110_3751 [Pirellulaceae bacterium]|nr:MAG: hypothetical protein KatS3mg110_3751 [Pirellulaceae bacterium]